jgi:Uma2 family endonuclease
MTLLVLDAQAEAEYIAERRAKGLDRYDEVWDGVYVMSPLANNEHQRLATRLASIMDIVIGMELEGTALCGCNVSDQDDEWTHNYRCPDVAVFLAETKAADRGPYWQGGPDFAVEVTSPGDRTWEKLDFYAKVGVRELVVVERKPWELIFLSLEDGKMIEKSRVALNADKEFSSAIVPFSFRLIMRANRPTIEVKHVDGRGWYAQGDPILPL